MIFASTLRANLIYSATIGMRAARQSRVLPHISWQDAGFTEGANKATTS